MIFNFVCLLRHLRKKYKRLVLRIYDKFISIFYPNVWRSVRLEYVPQHVMLTGGLVPHNRQMTPFNRIADTIATGYDCSIDLFTLHLPYAYWYYEDVSGLSAMLDIAFKKLGYRPLISCVSTMGDQVLKDNSSDENGQLFGKQVTIVILQPNYQQSSLSSANLVIQLLDQRHNNSCYIKQFIPDQRKLFGRLPGLNPDSTGVFSRQPDLIINFGGDYNETVQNLPFWTLRKALVFNSGSLRSFMVKSFVRVVEWYDHVNAEKNLVLEGK